MSERPAASPSPAGPAAPSAAAAASPPALPRSFVVFYAVIKDTDGRDKALKCLQYGLRYLRWSIRQRPRSAALLAAGLLRLWQSAASLPGSHALLPASAVDAALSSLTERLELLASTFSTTRKAIRLFKCRQSAAAARSLQPAATADLRTDSALPAAAAVRVLHHPHRMEDAAPVAL